MGAQKQKKRQLVQLSPTVFSVHIYLVKNSHILPKSLYFKLCAWDTALPFSQLTEIS
jgi:hypothetical protein